MYYSNYFFNSPSSVKITILQFFTEFVKASDTLNFNIPSYHIKDMHLLRLMLMNFNTCTIQIVQKGLMGAKVIFFHSVSIGYVDKGFLM